MKTGLLVLLILLAGCASAPPPGPAVPSVVNSASLPTAGSGPVEPEPRAPDIVALEPRDDSDRRNPAVLELLDQSEMALTRGELNRAVALAERAMLIDRYDPEVYLLLARAHRSLGNLSLSRQYAVRGLAYTQPNSLLYARLQALR